jgi:hypothetical protein
MLIQIEAENDAMPIRRRIVIQTIQWPMIPEVGQYIRLDQTRRYKVEEICHLFDTSGGEPTVKIYVTPS